MASIDLKISPENLIDWSYMEDWENGTSSAPTEHTLAGSGATIAREATTVKFGTYSAAVTRNSNDATLYHDFADYADYTGRKMTFGCWVYATVASRARLSISDGVGSTESSYHSGGSSFEFLTVTHDVDASATRIRCEMQVNTGDTTAYFDGGILVEGADVFTDLDDANQDIGGWDISRRQRSKSFTIPRKDGRKVPNVQIDSLRFRIPGAVVVYDNATSARTKIDTLKKAINSVIISPDGTTQMKNLHRFDDRFYKCFAVMDAEDWGKTTGLHIPFRLRVDIPEPYEYYIGKLRSATTIDSSPKTATVTNNGSAFSRPVINVVAGSANITAVTVENVTTQQSVSYTGTITSGNTLVIDTEDLTVENNGSDDIANSTGERQIVLLPGDNEFKYTVTGGSTDSIVKIDWYDRWV